jgi:hypothetical protein
MAESTQGIWERAWKDWSGRGWLVRTLCMGALAVAIGYFLGPRMALAHYPPWVGNLVAGGGAALAWAVLTFIIALAKAPGRLLREANAKIRAMESIRPRLSACLRRDSRRVFLVIKNDGAIANVSAKISYSGALNGADAAWSTRPDREYRMGNGDSGMISVARKDSYSATMEWWCVQHLANGRKDDVRCDPAIPRPQVAISVFSEPESLEPPIRCTFTLLAGGRAVEELTGVNWCADASPSPPPADPPSSTGGA